MFLFFIFLKKEKKKFQKKKMQRECRICLENLETSTNQLFSPCLCKGTNAFIHQNCLFQSRQMNFSNFVKCSTCGYVYKYESRFFLDDYLTEYQIIELATKLILLFMFLFFVFVAARIFKASQIVLIMFQFQIINEHIFCFDEISTYKLVHDAIKDHLPPRNIRSI